MSRGRVVFFLLLLALLMISRRDAMAEKALFIGNSYTLGSHEPAAEHHGGLPAMVERVAQSKGRSLLPGVLAERGQNWAFHLGRPVTDSVLMEGDWTVVVLQEHSTRPTRLGNPAAFLRDGRAFFQKIRRTAPEARIVLYQTWARAPGHEFYEAGSFRDPDAMTRELASGYQRLAVSLKELDPDACVQVAPIGEAFRLCRLRHPEIGLYGEDLHHANAEGLYLAALVLYATLFEDSPLGATSEMPGVRIAPEIANHLQEIAREAVGFSNP
jgi:hypothetical protein